MKLRLKFAAVVVAVLLLAGLAILYLVNSQTYGIFSNEFGERGAVLTHFIGTQSADYILTEDIFALHKFINDVKKNEQDIEYIFIVDPAGNVLVHTFERGFPTDLLWANSFKQDGAANVITIATSSGNIRDFAYPLPGGMNGAVRLGLSEKHFETHIGETRIQLILLIFGIIILGIFVIDGLLSHFILAPLLILNNTFREFDKGNLGAIVTIESDDELSDLAAIFNQTAHHLVEANNALKAYQGELEKRVLERTKELNEKMLEMADTKRALQNMMDDTDELNRSLIATKEKLSENVQELKATDIKKNEFMSIAAHELKTPMTSIHGFAQLLQDRKVADDPEKRDKYLKIMDHETMRLAKLVNDVLDLSRIDLNAISFDIVEVDINSVMDLIKTEMAVQMKAKGLESEFVVAKDVPKIFTDRERFMQILLNLINNSVKYTPKGKITVTVQKDGGNVHFIVKDTGIGISKENAPKIFTRFYQVDSSYTRSAGGVGLGLSLCKEMIERLGGKIWFESEVDKGSEFHFTLPIKNESIKTDEKQIEKNTK